MARCDNFAGRGLDLNRSIVFEPGAEMDQIMQVVVCKDW